MGSKPVREAHMVKYGATMRQLSGDLDERVVPSSEIETSCNRLSKPRRCAKKFVYESRNRGEGSSSQMDDLFPSHLDVDEVSGIAQEIQYPEDWRRLPAEKGGGKLTWIYEAVQLDIETPLSKSETHIQHALSRALRDRGVTPVGVSTSRKEVRSMVREGDRCGVLVDIVATRRNILSGVPHELAAFIYKMLEEEYPIVVRFAFVGITDNATKLVAKDIFDSRQSGKLKRLSFGDIDGEHLFVAYPRQNDAALLRERGVMERAVKEEEHRLRTWTPKYIPPAEPSWMPGAVAQVARARAFLAAPDIQAVPVSKASCSRCWSHKATGEHEVSPALSRASPAQASRGARGQLTDAVSQKPHVDCVKAPPVVPEELSVYTMENCVERLRQLRRKHRAEKGRVTVVRQSVELQKVVTTLANKLSAAQ